MYDLVAGAIAGFCTATLLQPFDVIKTVQQMNAGPSSASVRSIAVELFENHGLAGLWRGSSAAICRATPGACIYFAIITYMEKWAPYNHPLPGWYNMLTGGISKGVAVIALSPFSVIKTRMESKSQHEGLAKIATHIYKCEGLVSFWRGLFPTLMRDVPFSGAFLFVYRQSKNFTSRFEQTPILTFASASVSGCVASVITHPFDLLRTRLQLRTDKPWGDSLFTYAKKQYELDGFKVLWRGLCARMMKRTATTALGWTLFDSCKN
eukprot:GHVL01009859.1.p1 GENE.GHVL01009859.1~~GHVL01009859.1.p1  ORF type:complete len:265 (+),score=25.12 GHVL01009859.1:166-960(+)